MEIALKRQNDWFVPGNDNRMLKLRGNRIVQCA